MQQGRGPDAGGRWDDPLSGATDPVVSAVALLVLGAGLGSLFGLPLLNAVDFWIVFAIGYAVVVPLVSVLRGRTTDAAAGPSDRSGRSRTEHIDESAEDVDAALDRLRDRYARGDLSEEQFERKLETLLETETPEAARERMARGSAPTDAGGEVASIGPSGEDDSDATGREAASDTTDGEPARER
jgi:uncharacterized membrane protein